MEKWQVWSDKYLELSQREKIIIAASAVFLAGYLIFLLLIEPAQQELQRRTTHFGQLNQELNDSRMQIDAIKVALQKDPNDRTKQEINALGAELETLNKRLDTVMTDYVSPDNMALELTKLLSATNQVRVVGLSIEPPVKIDIELAQEPSSETLPSYYRHQFTLEVQGDYFNLMNFVKTVLGKNRRFRVDALSYQVETHPNATLSLSLMTVSDSKHVIRL